MGIIATKNPVPFKDWVRELDNDMSWQQRRIFLRLDNASAHTVSNPELKSVTALFLPPNTKFRLQPLDAGILASFKCRRQLDHTLGLEEQGTETDKRIFTKLTT